jgi:hypothetical protein
MLSRKAAVGPLRHGAGAQLPHLEDWVLSCVLSGRLAWATCARDRVYG